MKPLYQSFNHVKNSIFYNVNAQRYSDISFIFFDDNLDNMRMAKNIGWTSVWIPHRNYKDNIKNMNHPFVDYKYNNIFDALKDINTIINDVNKQPFIASNSFQGKRNGYHFKKGNNGLGYYLDNK